MCILFVQIGLFLGWHNNNFGFWNLSDSGVALKLIVVVLVSSDTAQPLQLFSLFRPFRHQSSRLQL